MDRSGFENSPKETLVGGQTSMQDDMVKLYCHNKHTELTKKSCHLGGRAKSKQIYSIITVHYIYIYILYIYISENTIMCI